MSSEQECNLITQRLDILEHRLEQQDKDVHNHIKELREDIQGLTKNTKDLVDAITAGKVISKFAAWVLPILILIGSLITWLTKGQPPH